LVSDVILQSGRRRVGVSPPDGTAAINLVRADGKRFLEITKDRKVTEDDMYTLMTSPNLVFTKLPSNVGPMLDFMSRVGSLKNKPASWKDVFFPEAQSLPGS